MFTQFNIYKQKLFAQKAYRDINRGFGLKYVQKEMRCFLMIENYKKWQQRL